MNLEVLREAMLHILSVTSNYEGFPKHRDAIIDEVQSTCKRILDMLGVRYD